MNSKKIILLNFEETRRRSINLWHGIPLEFINWKPDKKAFTFIEMIRHILEAEHLFHIIIKNRGNLGPYVSPWKNIEYINIAHELKFAENYRSDFLNMIKNLNEVDLENITINRTEVNQCKKLGDYLNRMLYHEAVHTGQILGYLRTLGVKRPEIWD